MYVQIEIHILGAIGNSYVLLYVFIDLIERGKRKRESETLMRIIDQPPTED